LKGVLTGVNARGLARLREPPDDQSKFFPISMSVAGTNKCGLRFANVANRPFLPSMGHEMSLILPISFLVTLLCVLLAIDWALYQQILFVGAALAATVWACSLEAWSCQEAPVRSEDERGPYHPPE
jgi:hypothetical protein